MNSISKPTFSVTHEKLYCSKPDEIEPRPNPWTYDTVLYMRQIPFKVPSFGVHTHTCMHVRAYTHSYSTVTAWIKSLRATLLHLQMLFASISFVWSEAFTAAEVNEILLVYQPCQLAKNDAPFMYNLCPQHQDPNCPTYTPMHSPWSERCKQMWG
jgi:hypothetical protein